MENMDTKYDLLVTEVSDKIIQCFNLLQTDNVISSASSLKTLYDQYIHPEKMDTTDPSIWNHLAAGDVLDVFDTGAINPTQICFMHEYKLERQ